MPHQGRREDTRLLPSSLVGHWWASVIPNSAHENPALEARVEREEAVQLGRRLAVERLHLRRPAGAGAGDDVGLAVAVQVAGGHVHPATEGVVEREEGV